MTEAQHCPECGAPLSPSAEGAICPACLLKAALADPGLTTGAADDERLAARRPAAERPDRVGPYKILEQIGEGGMGVVYLAEQSAPIRRRVALKLIKLGMDTQQVVARFDAERQALALMDHPNIASVFDAGATDDGRPYFVMEYVPGVPITDYCDRHRLSTRARLALFQDVCGAIQHAHHKGIIHRDLKPTNLLVMEQDGRPVPKVIDFGIAKATNQRLTERTLFTEHGLLVGTPEYMSPEQADATGREVDSRTDIYSLGIVLYELLAGGLPFETAQLRSAGYAEIQRIIKEDEPPKPSTKVSSLGATASEVATRRHTTLPGLARLLRGDLDWITLKTLEKDPQRRYSSASELAADIGRHLHDEPVTASPPGALYRGGKFVRKHQGPVAAVAALFLVLTLGLAISLVLYVRAERARREEGRQRQVADEQRASAQAAVREADRQRGLAEIQTSAAETQRTAAERQLDEALHQSYRANLLAADLSLQATERVETRQRLELIDPALRGWEWRYLHRVASEAFPATSERLGSMVRAVAFSGTGREILARVEPLPPSQGRPMPALMVRLSTRGARSATQPVAPGGIAVAISPDGSQTVSVAWNVDPARIPCSADRSEIAPSCRATATTPEGRVLGPEERDRLVVTDTATGAVIATLQHPNLGIWTATRPVAVRLRTGDGLTLGLVLDGDRPIARLSPGRSDAVSAVFGSDGTRLATWSWDNLIHVWDLRTRTLTQTFRGHHDGIMSVAFSADMTRVVSSSADGTVYLWRLGTGTPVASLRVAGATVATLSPNGRRVAIGTNDGSIRLWEPDTPSSVPTFRRLAGGVSSLAFGPDSSRLVSGSDDGMRLWDVPSGMEIRFFDRGVISSVAFSPDGDLVASGSSDGRVSVWIASSPDTVLAAGAIVSAVGFTSSRTGVLAASWDGKLRVWDSIWDSWGLDWPPPLRVLELDSLRKAGTRVGSLALVSPDGRRVAVSYFQEDTTGRAQGTFLPSRILDLVDVDSAKTIVLAPSTDHNGPTGALMAMSADGTTLASATTAYTTQEQTVQWWSAVSGRAMGTWKGEGGTIMALAVGPQGRYIAIGIGLQTTDEKAPQGKILVWGTATRRVVTSILTSDVPRSMAFTASGAQIVVAPYIDSPRIWDVATGVNVGALIGHRGFVNAIAVSPDGTRIVTAGGVDQTVRIWDAVRHELLLTLRLPEGGDLSALAFSADGARIAAGSFQNVYVWDAGTAGKSLAR